MKKNAKAQAIHFDLKNILPIYIEMYQNTIAKFEEAKYKEV